MLIYLSLFLLGSTLGIFASEFADRWGCSQRYHSSKQKKLFLALACGIGTVFLYWWEVQWKLTPIGDPVFPFSFLRGIPFEWQDFFVVGLYDLNFVYYFIILQPFILYLVLFTFLLAATLTDFYEMIIPDSITVAGTAIALLIALMCLYPGAGLTASHRVDMHWDGVDGGGCTYVWVPLDVWSPNECPDSSKFTINNRDKIQGEWVRIFSFFSKGTKQSYVFVFQIYLLIAMVLLWWFWCFAVLDRVWYTKLPFRKTNAIFWRYLYRSPRTKYIIAAALIVSLWLAFYVLASPILFRDVFPLLSSLVGMATGMILVWGIRLAAQWVLRVEAMGFGDVTLMGMIGAFLGWQPVLLIFFLAPFFGLIYGIINVLLGKGRAVPYGPFLCLATIVVVVFWGPIWANTAEYFAFGIGTIGLGLFMLLFVFAGLLHIVHKIMSGLRR
jgi:prepilin signal peptidase PulO-like enzyme (type II secretory pathway)